MKNKYDMPRPIIKRMLMVAVVMVLLLGMSACGKEEQVLNDSDDVAQGIWGDNELGIDPAVDEALQDYNNVLIIKEVDSESIANSQLPNPLLVFSINNSSKNQALYSISTANLGALEIKGLSGKATNENNINVVRTVNAALDLNIHEYITLNNDVIAGVIDRLGGIELNISEEVKQQANFYIDNGAIPAEHIDKTGLINVSGWQAVAYAACTVGANESKDINRSSRQNEVFQQTIKKASAVSESERIQILDEYIGQIDTNLSRNTAVKRLEQLMASAAGLVEIDPWTKTGGEQALEEGIKLIHQTMFGDE